MAYKKRTTWHVCRHRRNCDDRKKLEPPGGTAVPLVKPLLCGLFGYVLLKAFISVTWTRSQICVEEVPWPRDDTSVIYGSTFWESSWRCRTFQRRVRTLGSRSLLSWIWRPLPRTRSKVGYWSASRLPYSRDSCRKKHICITIDNLRHPTLQGRLYYCQLFELVHANV